MVLLVERRLAEVLFRRRHPVAPAADLELVQMAVAPTQRDLQHVVQFPEREITRHPQPPPDGRLDLPQRDLEHQGAPREAENLRLLRHGRWIPPPERGCRVEASGWLRVRPLAIHSFGAKSGRSGRPRVAPLSSEIL